MLIIHHSSLQRENDIDIQGKDMDMDMHMKARKLLRQILTN